MSEGVGVSSSSSFQERSAGFEYKYRKTRAKLLLQRHLGLQDLCEKEKERIERMRNWRTADFKRKKAVVMTKQERLQDKKVAFEEDKEIRKIQAERRQEKWEEKKKLMEKQRFSYARPITAPAQLKTQEATGREEKSENNTANNVSDNDKDKEQSPEDATVTQAGNTSSSAEDFPAKPPEKKSQRDRILLKLRRVRMVDPPKTTEQPDNSEAAAVSSTDAQGTTATEPEPSTQPPTLSLAPESPRIKGPTPSGTPRGPARSVSVSGGSPRAQTLRRVSTASAVTEGFRRAGSLPHRRSSSYLLRDRCPAADPEAKSELDPQLKKRIQGWGETVDEYMKTGVEGYVDQVKSDFSVGFNKMRILRWRWNKQVEGTKNEYELKISPDTDNPRYQQLLQSRVSREGRKTRAERQDGDKAIEEAWTEFQEARDFKTLKKVSTIVHHFRIKDMKKKRPDAPIAPALASFRAARLFRALLGKKGEGEDQETKPVKREIMF